MKITEVQYKTSFQKNIPSTSSEKTTFPVYSV